MYNLTELCEIANKYGADKSPTITHCYTPYYYELLKDIRPSVKKVLEFGIGSFRQYKHIPNYQIGASLRMWRDFFPNAQVYGADIEPTSMFKDDRIETFLCDEQDVKQILSVLSQTGTDIDLFVDDASHRYADQKLLFETVMPLLPKGAIYIVEDCGRNRRICRENPQYHSFVPELQKNHRPLASDKIAIFIK